MISLIAWVSHSQNVSKKNVLGVNVSNDQELFYDLFSECYPTILCWLNKASRSARMKREGGVPFPWRKQSLHTMKKALMGPYMGTDYHREGD